MGFWIFMGVAIGIAALILSVIAWVNRCKKCGNVGHAFSSEKVADFDSGKAFVVCKRCGARKHQGTVSMMAPSCGSVGVLEPSMRMAVIKVIVGVMETAVMVVAVNKVLATSRLC